MAKQEPKKSITFKDARGNTVTPGSRVAYNYSGDVATGTVISITNSVVKIQRDPEWTTNSRMVYKNNRWESEPILEPTPKYSNVKNRRSVLVLYEDRKIADQITAKERNLQEWYDSMLAYETEKVRERERKIEDKTSQLIKAIINAWDVDEIKDKLVEIFGEDVLKQEEDVPDWIQAVLDGR